VDCLQKVSENNSVEQSSS